MFTHLRSAFIILMAILILLQPCNPGNKKLQHSWSDLPSVTSLDSLKQTAFAVTMESSIEQNKNIIYAPTLLFAWNKVEEILGSRVLISDSSNPLLKELTGTSWHKDVLRNDEFKVDVETLEDQINAYAYFNKTLPFATELQRVEQPILFERQPVAAFGMQDFNAEITRNAVILFYQNDDRFMLQLLPKDQEHEIILVKGLAAAKNLLEAFRNATVLRELGDAEQLLPNQGWRYHFLPADNFAIPEIAFNIATNIHELEGTSFTTADQKRHRFIEVFQRTGFILNEKGAVAESEVTFKTDSTGPAPEIIHPKHMIFDKPFYIFLKRKEQSNPYFAIKVDNAELMVKK